jgi:hypothetical protein
MTLWPDRPAKGLDAMNCDTCHVCDCSLHAAKPPLPKPRCQRRAVVVLCPRLAGDYQGSLLDLTTFVHGFLNVGVVTMVHSSHHAGTFNLQNQPNDPARRTLSSMANELWSRLPGMRLAESSFRERDTVTVDGSLVGNDR